MAVKGKKTTKSASSEKPAKQPAREEYDNTNRGVLFQNDKDGNEKRPDFTGNIDVNGEKFRIAAWTRQSEKVGDYLSLSVSPMEDGE